MLSASAALFRALPYWDGHEGPRARISIAPGAFAVSRRDLARRERTAEREQRADRRRVDALAAYLREKSEFPPEPTPRREIIAWSRKSRANMVRALCEMDYGPLLRHGRPPAMVTLTYPGDWLAVAPCGSTAKRHLQMWRRAYRRAWGTDPEVLWKEEFQRRGAPHFHLFMVPPDGKAHSRSDAPGSGLPFREWLSVVWADIVDHPDPIEYLKHLAAGTGVDYAEGLRASDPKRLAVYFVKHGSMQAKEYQHIVPPEWREPGQGPGRFWGYWKLQREVHQVEVPEEDAETVARVCRRWAHAQRTTRQVRAPRVKGGRVIPKEREVVGLAGAQLLASRGPVRTRSVRRRAERMTRGAGWVSVNDGASFAAQVSRWLVMCQEAARILGLTGRRRH